MSSLLVDLAEFLINYWGLHLENSAYKPLGERGGL
jgi:hypothetical protein